MNEYPRHPGSPPVEQQAPREQPPTVKVEGTGPADRSWSKYEDMDHIKRVFSGIFDRMERSDDDDRAALIWALSSTWCMGCGLPLAECLDREPGCCCGVPGEKVAATRCPQCGMIDMRTVSLRATQPVADAGEQARAEGPDAEERERLVRWCQTEAGADVQAAAVHRANGREAEAVECERSRDNFLAIARIVRSARAEGEQPTSPKRFLQPDDFSLASDLARAAVAMGLDVEQGVYKEDAAPTYRALALRLHEHALAALRSEGEQPDGRRIEGWAHDDGDGDYLVCRARHDPKAPAATLLIHGGASELGGER